MVATLLGVLALAIPALATDPRCEEQLDRAECQSDEQPPEPTTTTTPPPDSDPERDRVPEPRPTTTTTQARTTLPENPFGAVSVIGCSNTNYAASGYLAMSEADLLVNTAWAGHTVEFWAVRTEGWVDHYLPLRPDDGFDGAWFNLCERASAGLTQQNSEIVLAKIWAIDPGIPVWISPLNFYEGEGCTVTNGNQIPNEGAIIADALVAQYDLVHRGPDIGPLTADQLRSDLCHPDSEGTASMGAQLKAFFDG
jgi:hypothetical protein